jgi:hypothetical protein
MERTNRHRAVHLLLTYWNDDEARMKNTIPLKRSRAIIHLKRGIPVVFVGEPISRATIEKTRCELQQDRTKKILDRFAPAYE